MARGAPETAAFGDADEGLKAQIVDPHVILAAFTGMNRIHQ
jgi:hypothetical protein